MKILIVSILGTYYKLAYLIKNMTHWYRIPNLNWYLECEAFARQSYLLIIFILNIFESKFRKWEKHTDCIFS